MEEGGESVEGGAGAPRVSVVIPAYNEAGRLPFTLAGWIGYLGQQPYSAEVLVVDDGSGDGTSQVAREVAAGVARSLTVRVLTLAANSGKGGAVRAGVLASAGECVFYVDADLNIAPRFVAPALQLLSGGYDVVAGQRRLTAYAVSELSLPRLLAGALVQATRRTLVLPVIRDTQCGFKGFRRDVAREIFRRTLIRSFAFDIEVLFLARELGARIAELPVDVTFRPGSSYNLRKHLGPFLRDIARIRRHARQGRYALVHGARPQGPDKGHSIEGAVQEEDRP